MEITRYERQASFFDSCAAMEKAGFPNGLFPPGWGASSPRRGTR